MSAFSAFRRAPVPQQYAQHLRVVALPAPQRGIIQSENESYMAPGGAIVQDNWLPTMRGDKLRGGTIRWCDIHDGLAINDPARKPIISAFEYSDGVNQRMFAANADTLYNVTLHDAAVVKSGQASGNYAFAQMSNMAGSVQTNWGIAVNAAGDYALRYNGSTDTWVTLDASGGGTPSDGASYITGPAGPIQNGAGLSYVWKYRDRLFFIQAGSMTAWYLGLNAVGGVLQPIPLAGSATLGGKLLWGSTWSLDTGAGLDDKCVFCTDMGELLIFSGGNPGDVNNWRQEGRYRIPPPLGMNAHIQLGGDLLVLTVEGIVPVSQAINKDAGTLDLAMMTVNIKPLWRQYVAERRSWPWSARRWDEQGTLYIATPGGQGNEKSCLVANTATGAWCRLRGRFDSLWDPTCFIRMREDAFFGTQAGIVMQMERTGFDDGNDGRVAYVATLVFGWEMFGAPANQVVFHQARATFHSAANEPFQPQLTATTDYLMKIPLPPEPGPDPGLREVWDEGTWDDTSKPVQGGTYPTAARWDQPSGPSVAPVRNTLWVSIGETGYAHAPIVQVSVAQQARPDVELISLSCTFEPAGVNV